MTAPYPALLQQRQHRLRHLVALRQHRRTGMLHNLCASQRGGFLRIVGIENKAAGYDSRAASTSRLMTRA